MHPSFAGLCLLASLVLLCPPAHAGAAEPGISMHAALEQMVAAQDLTSDLSQIDGERAEGRAILERTAEELIASSAALDAAQKARARRILAELAPRIVETIRVRREQLLTEIGPDMMRASYPRHFTAAEISALASYYASPSYRKMRPIMSRVEREARQTGADRLALWRQYAAEELSVEDLVVLREFRTGELGRKLDATIPQLYREWGVVWNTRVKAVLDAAMAAYREEFARRMAQQP